MKKTQRARVRARGRIPAEDGGIESYALAPQMGEGIFYTKRLRAGLTIVYADYRFHPGAVSVREVNYGNDVVFRFRLAGKATLSYRGSKEIFEFSPGDCAVVTTERPRKGITREESTGDRKSYVTLRMSRMLLKQYLHAHTDPLARALFGKKTQRTGGPIYFERRTIPPQAELAIQQIFGNSSEGETKRLFLEAKCLELLALFLDSAPAPKVRAATPVKFSARDIEAIKSARDILISNLMDPPSLEELGALVGMRPTKLKLGFKHVFERTCFNYLRERRLEQSREMLAAGNVSIEEAGRAAGFRNASHFTQAFRKHYGVLPKNVRGQKL